MAGKASKLLLFTLLPVLAIGAPTAAQGTVTVTVTNDACGTTSSSSISHIPTSATGSTSSTPKPSTTSTSSASSAQPKQNSCGQWVIPGTGTFANKDVYTFTGTTLPAGLTASNYQVDDRIGGAPYNHVFNPANVAVSGGYLNLKVPGGQKPTSKVAISSAEITTNTNMLYGSVRINAIFSTVPGTCHGISLYLPTLSPSGQQLTPAGNFFYYSDNQEIDIEYLTNSSSTSNPGGQGLTSPPWLQYTNQAVQEGGTPTYATGVAPADVAVVHEYRVDWVPGQTKFFLDGVLQQTFTTNVPSTAGPWVWNVSDPPRNTRWLFIPCPCWPHLLTSTPELPFPPFPLTQTYMTQAKPLEQNWANGDPAWTVGPPSTDNIFKIQSITMYYDVPSQSC